MKLKEDQELAERQKMWIQQDMDKLEANWLEDHLVWAWLGGREDPDWWAPEIYFGHLKPLRPGCERVMWLRLVDADDEAALCVAEPYTGDWELLVKENPSGVSYQGMIRTTPTGVDPHAAACVFGRDLPPGLLER